MKNKPILLLKDIERQKPHPYEMLSFGQWTGHRFRWSRDLYLEIFPRTPYAIYRYANDCVVKSYPSLVEELSALNTAITTREDQTSMFIIYQGELLGYYKPCINHEYKHCSVEIKSIAEKINKDIVLAILSEIQMFAKQNGMLSIGVDCDLPGYAVPHNIPGVSVSRRGFLNNYFSYDVDTTLSPGAKLDHMSDFDTRKQEKLQNDQVKLSAALESNWSVTFAIRDEKNKFLALAVLNAEPHLTNVCNLRYLFVAPKLRGQGLGQKILRLVEECLRKAKINNIVLETDDNMVPDFYLKRGYNRTAAITIVSDNYTYNPSCMFLKTMPAADATPPSPPQLANPLRLR